VLAASPPRGHAEAEAADPLALVAPVTKWARTVPSAERLGDYLTTAIRMAVSGRPGPAVLIVPQDLFRAETGGAAPSPIAAPSSPADGDAIGRAADQVAAAERPLAIAGFGAFRSGAADALRALAEEFGVPVLGNGSGRGLVPEDDALGFSWPYAQIAAHRADCVIVVGEVLTQRLGFGLPPRFARDARFIQIDPVAEVIGRNRPIDCALLGDPDATCALLVERLRERRVTARPAWLPAALADRAATVARLAEPGGTAIHPLALGKALQARLPRDAVLVGDGADIANWMYGALRVRRAGGFLDHYPLGAMGSGTALAVGAAAALREAGDPAPVVLVTGDGSIGFHPGELHAAALAGLALKVVVGNDGAWGTEAHGQIAALGRTLNTELGVLPYARLAEAFGCEGLTCDRLAELRGSIDALLAAPGPALLDVRIDPAAGAELKTNPLASNILFSDIAEARSAFDG
jgi:acetolactate synthase-1/2/3 large subunit